MQSLNQKILRPAMIIALLLAATALAGCYHGGDDDMGGGMDDGTDGGTDDGTDDGTSSMQLVFAEHEELGSILVDGDGMTLYIFDNDDPGESNCFDTCAENWPPLLADEVPDGPGELNLTLIDRDGEQQVATNDQPLYYFIQDEEPGDANGEGLNDVWWVVRESEV